MRSSFYPVRLLAVAALFVLVLAAGCGQDEKIDVFPDSVRVVDGADGSPVAGVKVVLMDGVSNLPVAGPALSDAQGRLDPVFYPAPDQDLLVFGGVDYRVLAQPGLKSGAAAAEGPPGGSFLDPVSADPMPPVRTLIIQVLKVVPDSLPRIAGRVVDAGSGLPLDRVFVGLSPYLTGYQGATSASDDVTGGDGLFSVSRIPFATDPVTENLIQINPLRFTRHGYRPVIWKYESPNGSRNVDISGITIAMTPVDQSDDGAISGRLLRDGAAAAGIVVGLGALDLPKTGKAAVGMPGWSAVTDQDGLYTIGGLPTGTYLLQPGFLLGDGAFFPNQPGNVPLEVAAGRTTDAGDLVVLHEISPRWPSHGQILQDPPPYLEWSEVAGAVGYEVRFDRGILPAVETNRIDLPDSLASIPGLHYWSVLARDGGGEIIAATQIQFVYRLREPVD